MDTGSCTACYCSEFKGTAAEMPAAVQDLRRKNQSRFDTSPLLSLPLLSLSLTLSFFPSLLSRISLCIFRKITEYGSMKYMIGIACAGEEWEFYYMPLDDLQAQPLRIFGPFKGYFLILSIHHALVTQLLSAMLQHSCKL